jgi:2-oxoglutarate-Fe(II)-dependent oxygenase superfamily protein
VASRHLEQEREPAGRSGCDETFPFGRALEEIKAAPTERFTEAAPFPHIVFDGLFDPALIRTVHDCVMRQAGGEQSHDQGIEVKWRSSWESEYSIPEPGREIVRFLNSGLFLRELARLSGIDLLIPDPYFSGGGFNRIERGGLLDVHVDGNWHDAMGVHRRLNAILYLNQDWRPEWGGPLGFYDEKGEKEVVAIAPLGNRLVVFETHDYTYHGHPEPLDCPADQGRTSIILYYYTAAPRPAHQIRESRPHSALWRRKDWLDKRGSPVRG